MKNKLLIFSLLIALLAKASAGLMSFNRGCIKASVIDNKLMIVTLSDQYNLEKFTRDLSELTVQEKFVSVRGSLSFVRIDVPLNIHDASAIIRTIADYCRPKSMLHIQLDDSTTEKECDWLLQTPETLDVLSCKIPELVVTLQGKNYIARIPSGIEVFACDGIIATIKESDWSAVLSFRENQEIGFFLRGFEMLNYREEFKLIRGNLNSIEIDGVFTGEQAIEIAKLIETNCLPKERLSFRINEEDVSFLSINTDIQRIASKIPTFELIPVVTID